MTTNPVDLILEVRSADGTSTEYYQTDQDHIGKTLRALAAPRLLTQPQLVLASNHSVSTIPCRVIDMVLARTSGPTSRNFPMVFPPGLLEITEVPRDSVDEDIAIPQEDQAGDRTAPTPMVFHVEVHTLGGWTVSLRVVGMAHSTAYDQRQACAHLFDLPVVPFLLQDGGVGLVNPNNITRVSAYPASVALPETALPMDLLRWTSSRCKNNSKFQQCEEEQIDGWQRMRPA